MTNRLTGFAAIEYAKTHELPLCKYTDPIEDAREDLTIAEAHDVARDDARLLYIDVPETVQIATPEFCAWINTTSFAGIIRPGDQWDTEVAWPSAETMAAARQCFDFFVAGDLAAAERTMHTAQEPFV